MSIIGFGKGSVHEVVELVAAVEVTAAVARAFLDASASIKSVSVNAAVNGVTHSDSIVTAASSMVVGVVEVIVDLAVAAVAAGVPEVGCHTLTAGFFVRDARSWVSSGAPQIFAALFFRVAGVVTSVQETLGLSTVAAEFRDCAIVEQWAVVFAAWFVINNAGLFPVAPVVAPVAASIAAVMALISQVAEVLAIRAASLRLQAGVVLRAPEESAEFIAAVFITSSLSGL